MNTGFAIVPQPHGGEGFVRLSRAKQGRIFEKHILNYGPLLYPGVKGGKVDINDAWADRLIKNFKAKVCDIVQVPLAGANNEHTEDPLRNIGEVVGLVKRNGRIYAQIDARDQEAADKLGKTLIGASAMLHLNYTDTRTGQKVGPTLLHVAVTNRPYVVGLDDFEEIIAASALGARAADGMSDAVVLTAPNQQEDTMGLDDLKAELKADYGIDVDALLLSAGVVDSAVALSNAVQEALTENGLLTLSNDEPTADELVGAIKSAGEKIVTLSNEVETVRAEKAKADATTHVEGLVRSGHILPANKEAQITLLLTNPDLFDALLPEQPIVRLSQESGTDPADPKPEGDVKSEVERLAALAAK
jgi:hypothetical protein